VGVKWREEKKSGNFNKNFLNKINKNWEDRKVQ
jgi:hypothetical protein